MGYKRASQLSGRRNVFTNATGSGGVPHEKKGDRKKAGVGRCQKEKGPCGQGEGLDGRRNFLARPALEKRKRSPRKS